MDSSEQGEKGKEKGQGGIAQKIGKVLGKLWGWIWSAVIVVFWLLVALAIIGAVANFAIDFYKQATIKAGTISKEGVIVWKDDKAREKGTNLIEAGINDTSFLGPLMVCAPPMGTIVVVTNGGFFSPMVLIVEGENKGCEGIVSISDLSPSGSDVSKIIAAKKLLREMLEVENPVSEGDIYEETSKPQTLEQEQDSNFITNLLTYSVGDFQLWHIGYLVIFFGLWLWWEWSENKHALQIQEQKDVHKRGEMMGEEGEIRHRIYPWEKKSKERLDMIEQESDKERRDENH